MRRLRALGETGAHRRRRRGTLERDLAGASVKIGGVQEPRHRDVHETRIAQIFGAIREDALGDLGDEVHIARAVEGLSGERGCQALFHAEQLRECEATRARGRCRDDLSPSPVEA